jgi:hypothetical protein
MVVKAVKYGRLWKRRVRARSPRIVETKLHPAPERQSEAVAANHFPSYDVSLS